MYSNKALLSISRFILFFSILFVSLYIYTRFLFFFFPFSVAFFFNFFSAAFLLSPSIFIYLSFIYLFPCWLVALTFYIVPCWRDGAKWLIPNFIHYYSAAAHLIKEVWTWLEYLRHYNTQTGSRALDEIERDSILWYGKGVFGIAGWGRRAGVKELYREKEDFTSLVVIDRKRLPLKAVALKKSFFLSSYIDERQQTRLNLYAG